MGAVFGAVSFKDAITGASVMTSTLLQVSVVHTFILCVVMRILMGFCVGWVFRAFNKLTRGNIVSYFAGALSAPAAQHNLLHGLYLPGILQYRVCAGTGFNPWREQPAGVRGGIVGVQGLIGSGGSVAQSAV